MKAGQRKLSVKQHLFQLANYNIYVLYYALGFWIDCNQTLAQPCLIIKQWNCNLKIKNNMFGFRQDLSNLNFLNSPVRPPNVLAVPGIYSKCLISTQLVPSWFLSSMLSTSHSIYTPFIFPLLLYCGSPSTLSPISLFCYYSSFLSPAAVFLPFSLPLLHVSHLTPPHRWSFHPGIFNPPLLSLWALQHSQEGVTCTVCKPSK